MCYASYTISYIGGSIPLGNLWVNTLGGGTLTLTYAFKQSEVVAHSLPVPVLEIDAALLHILHNNCSLNIEM